MSHLLWKYYWENDVDKFRRLLAPAGPNSHAVSKSPAIGGGNGGYLGGSPLGTSPRPGNNKSRRASGYMTGAGRSKDPSNLSLGRAEVNSRDHAGLTVLLRASSSTKPSARDFVEAILDHPAIDLYVQDLESGWNCLHRSLYSGNVSIAKLLLEKERGLSAVGKVGTMLFKTKDHEGKSPFDVYNSTIATRSLRQYQESGGSDSDSDSGDSVGELTHIPRMFSHGPQLRVEGDELFMFGSNKNLSLGVGDEDDRQYPDRIALKRPSQLLHRFYQSYLASKGMEASTALPDLDDIPILIRERRLVIRDVVMSKLHTAVLTTDPMSNLYICGVGRGGRLGLGDENTQFKFVPVQGPFADKAIQAVALGQNHSMCVSDGELWTWGLNSDSQLGYALPPPIRADEEPMSLSPRQVFGSLKKEVIQGIAASAIHSVAHTGASLYCWGRNAGQLALMDADSRSLDVQQTPRRVAASLLSAPIEMVSATDRATTCLLSNFTVWVFTNYGYNLVKFPHFPDVHANHNFAASSFSNRYDPGRRDIHYVTSGGDTIAAINARGDLFTMHLNNNGDMNQPAGSTTNPVKIKGAVTQPQCIWDSRKDGVASVSVSEHGSVIICTESGAVWRRAKRVKIKAAAFVEASGAKRSDFKFERVPSITDCIAVRSSMFGAFAAIRKDSKVVSEEIIIDPQTLWDDVGSIMSLNEFTSSDLSDSAAEARKKWNAAIAREKPGSVPHEILRSVNIEEDLLKWIRFNSVKFEDVDMEIRSSLAPEIRIPVHGWALAGRSSSLRKALSGFRYQGHNVTDETFVIEKINNKTVLTLLNVDIFTVLNVVVYTYQDKVIPVWRYTKETTPEFERYRQVRSELMKVATKLHMPKLETAARSHANVENSLDADLFEALSDSRYFEDGDVVLELDGSEVAAHSRLICQRCPFFEGMFHGRSQGQWLASRRDGVSSTESVRVDLKHVSPETFQYVLQYLYADVGEDMFDKIAMATIDDFSELVLDVMDVANELMLDRLSQICQSVIGKFVTTRNIGNLLNEISPCSVTAFKDAGLEYVCLQLESMLENHMLDGLDEELLQELDEVVRGNQLAQFPFARSGRAELLLHEKYPDLVMDIEEERQRRVREMAFKYAQKEEEKKLSSSYKARFGSFDESPVHSQTTDRTRRKSRIGRNEPFSPSLRPKDSHGDLIFDMDEEDASGISSPMSPELNASKPRLDYDVDHMPQLPRGWREPKGKKTADASKSPMLSPPWAESMSPEVKQPRGHYDSTGTSSPKGGRPWISSALATSKLDLKDIMNEASSKSALTASLAAQTPKDAAGNKSQSKLSQKERKKQMQMQAEAQAAQDEEASKAVWEKATARARAPPWKEASPVPKMSLDDAMASDATLRKAISASAKPLVASEAGPQSAPRRTASPDTRFSGQGRMNRSPAVPSASKPSPKTPVVPHSKSYMKPAAKAEPSLLLGMADIIGQQAREQELVKESVAKRSLQEIQQEQEFQEWWDQESRRAREEGEKRQIRGKDKQDKNKDKEGTRGRRGRTGRGGGGKTKNTDVMDGGGAERSGGGSRGGTNKGKGVKRGTKA